MKYWDKRATTYDSIDWVNKVEPVRRFIEESMIEPHHKVLDIGCGTGKILQHVNAAEIIGIDISKDMQKIAAERLRGKENTCLINADFMKDFGHEGKIFDRILMRMVLHHQESTPAALKRVQNFMNDNSRFIVCEGVPPNTNLLPWFTEMFKLKEERKCWSDVGIRILLTHTNFNIIRTFTYETVASLRNWIDNAGIPEVNKKKIWEMHEELFSKQANREAYKVEKTESDYIISFKFVGYYCSKQPEGTK